MYYFSDTLPIKNEKTFCLFDTIWEGTQIKISSPNCPEVEKVKDREHCHWWSIFPVATPEGWQATIYQIVDKLQIKQNYVKLTWEIHFVLDQWWSF